VQHHRAQRGQQRAGAGRAGDGQARLPAAPHQQQLGGDHQSHHRQQRQRGQQVNADQQVGRRHHQAVAQPQRRGALFQRQVDADEGDAQHLPQQLRIEEIADQFVAMQRDRQPVAVGGEQPRHH